MTKSSYDVNNSTDDVDTEIYSLQRFFEMVCEQGRGKGVQGGKN